MAHGAEPDIEPFLDVRCVYVDAMNVIGSRPDGWWRDRDGAVRRLAARLEAFASRLDAEVVLVIDGGPVAGLPEGRDREVVIRYARRPGRDAADDRIIELLEAFADTGGGRPGVSGPASVVVTADRDLGRRARAEGARLVGPRRLLTVLDGLPDVSA